MRQRRLTTRCVISAVLATATTAACGGPPTGSADSGGKKTKAEQVYDKYRSMGASAREAALITAAKKEGSLTVYGTSSTSDDIAKAFTKKYGIKVNLYNAGTEAVYSRITQEAAARHYTVDVYEGDDVDVSQVERAGLLAPYDGPNKNRVPASARTADRVGVRTIAFVAAYNTNKVPAANLPTDFAGFADPKWKGQLSMEIGDYDWFYGMYQYYLKKGMTNDQVKSLMTKIASNARQTSGHTTQGQLLAAGQFGVALSSHTDTTDRLIKSHAPVSWGGRGKPTVQPVVLRYTDDALIANAPHPAAALLWVDFNLSNDGAAADLATDAIPAFPVASNPLDGLQTTTIDSVTLSRESSKWSTLYDQILRNASK